MRVYTVAAYHGTWWPNSIHTTHAKKETAVHMKNMHGFEPVILFEILSEFMPPGMCRKLQSCATYWWCSTGWMTDENNIQTSKTMGKSWIAWNSRITWKDRVKTYKTLWMWHMYMHTEHDEKQHPSISIKMENHENGTSTESTERMAKKNVTFSYAWARNTLWISYLVEFWHVEKTANAGCLSRFFPVSLQLT